MKILLLLPLLLAACASPQRRIEADPELFQSFPPGARESIRAGRVEPGFTPPMARMALGEPHRVYLRRTADTESEIWQYVWIRRETSTRPLIVGGNSRVSSTAWIDSEDTREIPLLRIEFRDGTAVAVEELRDGDD